MELDIFQYTFMQRALLEALLMGAMCSIIGVYVVLNGLSFIGAGISHSAFGGVALGLMLGINPVFSALVFSTLVAASIGFVSERGKLKHDTAVGIFFAATMGIGVLIISKLEGYYQDVFSYLFGNILSVTGTDIVVTTVVVGVVLLCVSVFYKELLALSFDAELAAVMGLPTRKLYYLLLVLMSISVVVAVKAIGVVLVSALLVTPAAAAYQLTTRFRTMMSLSVLFGTASSVTGLLLSAWLNLPSGAAIVLVATATFFLTWVFSPRRKKRSAQTLHGKTER